MYCTSMNKALIFLSILTLVGYNFAPHHTVPQDIQQYLVTTIDGDTGDTPAPPALK